jgi:hypothetical protein
MTLCEGFESAAELEAHLAAAHGAPVIGLFAALETIHELLHDAPADQPTEQFETAVTP